MSASPYYKNVAGDFYVEDGCCTACGVPAIEAPGMFAWDTDADCLHCYVCKQPSTPAEVTQTLNAIAAAELRCIRYRGTDPTVFERLGAMGEPEVCDFPPLQGIPVIFRNHVTFDCDRRERPSLKQIVAEFQSWATKNTQCPCKFRNPLQSRFKKALWFEFAWYEENYHRVYIARPSDNNTILMHHSPIEVTGGRGVSSLLDQWLKASAGFTNVRWFTADEWKQQLSGFPSPW